MELLDILFYIFHLLQKQENKICIIILFTTLSIFYSFLNVVCVALNSFSIKVTLEKLLKLKLIEIISTSIIARESKFDPIEVARVSL